MHEHIRIDGNGCVVGYNDRKAAMVFLYGVAKEKLSEMDFNAKEADYPVIYGIYAKKQ